MGSIDDIMQLCRLCLVKDQVNIPIFDESSDIRQTFLKINSCLPVKVSRDDNLPKKICDGCSYKLDMLYIFRNTSVDSEKQLITWLNQAGLTSLSQAVKDGAKPEIMVKQETFETNDARIEDNPDMGADAHGELEGQHPEMGVDAHSYIIQQQKLPYQQDFAFGEPSGSTAGLIAEEPAPKRAKRAASVKKHVPLETEEDELVEAAMQITKAEEEDSDDIDQPEYVEAPSTSADDQPGPSGVGKGTIEAPKSTPHIKQEETIIIDIIDEVYEEYHDISSPVNEVELSPPKEEEYVTDTDPQITLKKRQRTMCHECGVLVTWGYLNTHMYEMHYNNPNIPSPRVLCPECGILCKDRRSFNNHFRIHTFKCKDCPAVFKTKELLAAHAEVHQEYSCEDCDMTFTAVCDFIVHKATHENSTEYPCIKCPFIATSGEQLKEHLLKKHEGRKVYTCEICSKQFFGKSRYDHHMELHAGIKKYSCDLCVKKFLTLTYLKVHRDLNHHKELYGFDLSFACQECGRKFTFERSLKRHLSTIHKIGEDRTVSCPVCFKKIANNYNLKVHMRMHTGEKTNMCDSCGKAYHTYKSYKKHVLTHHPGQVPVPKTEPKSLPKRHVQQ